MLPVEFAIKDPLRKEKAQWYDGAVKMTVLKEDESVAYDLVIFEREDEGTGEVCRVFKIFRLFKLEERTELSADHEYISPYFKRSREAVHEWGKIETFIKDVAHFQFKL